MMKISARNQLSGTILDVHKRGHDVPRRDRRRGREDFASITNEAVAELGLEKGMKAKAVIKASDVMVAVD